MKYLGYDFVSKIKYKKFRSPIRHELITNYFEDFMQHINAEMERMANEFFTGMIKMEIELYEKRNNRTR